MTRTSLQLLTATTALLALAGAANATDITTSTTSVVQTSSSVAGVNVQNGVTVATTATSAIEISGTIATQVSNTVNVSATGTVTSQQVAGTVQVMAGSGGTVTVNNSGTIAGVAGNQKAIVNNSDVTGAMTVRNTGTISGSITTSNTADTFINSGSGSVVGNVDMGGGNDTVSILGGTISGTIDLGAGGADVLNVSSSTGFTTQGSISGAETVNVSGTAVINHGISGASLFRTDRNSTVTQGADMALATSGVMNVSGTYNVTGGKVVSASTFNFRNGVLGVGVASSSSAARLDVMDAAGAFTGGSLTINIAANAGYINSGTQFRIVSSTATGGAVLPSLTTVTSGLYTFTVSKTGGSLEDISLTILRAANSALATNASTGAVGTVLDTVSSSTNSTFVAIQNQLNQATSAAAVENALERLTPAADTGVALGAVDVNVQAGNQVSTRLASLRGNGKTMNTGDAMMNNHFWMNGFGNVTTQDDKKGVKGYDANTVGASFGLDTDTLLDGVTTGAAFSYGKSNVDSNSANGASTDIDNYLVSGYASKVFDQGFFVNGQASLGLGKYSSDRNTGIGTASAEYDGLQYSAKVEGGKDFTCDWWTFTPLASAQYSFVDLDKYTETGPAALTVDSKNFNVLDLGLGGQVAYNMPLESGGTLRPVARAKYIYRAGDNTLDTNSRFVAGGAAFSTQGVRADRNSVNLGTGITLSTVGGVDLSLDYDADIRSSLVGHTGQVKARWAF